MDMDDDATSDYSDINDRKIPNPLKSNIQGFAVMANSDGRRVGECDDMEERRNIRRF